MSIWNNISFQYGPIDSSAFSFLRKANAKDTKLEYKNNGRFKNVFVQTAKQVAAQTLESTLNQVLPAFERAIRDKHRKFSAKQQEANFLLTEINRQRQTVDYGHIDLDDGTIVYAYASDGSLVRESLFMWYDGPEDEVEQWQVPNLHAAYDQRGESSTIFFLDLMPTITMSSQKNVVLTQVQGRDYTRKELVSGGDLTFTINGVISTDMPGVYPVAMVQKFLKVCQYNGIINVNCQFLGQLNVEHIVIKDFSLGQQEYKNIQPYSISCVAIEEAEDITITDTINGVNEIIADQSSNSWYEKILASRMGDKGANTGSSLGASSLTSLVVGGIDKLVPNI